MNHQTTAVLFAGGRSPLLATLEAVFVRDGIAVHHVPDVATLADDTRAASTVTSAVLQVTPPTTHGPGLRDYRRRVHAELRGLVGAMPTPARILIVVDARHLDRASRLPDLRVEAAMSRLRAAAARERGADVTVNALVLRGTLDDGTVAQRVWAIMRSGSFPDTGFVVTDDDLRDKSIASAIAEQCS
jgi:hypothetical protein